MNKSLLAALISAAMIAVLLPVVAKDSAGKVKMTDAAGCQSAVSQASALFAQGHTLDAAEHLRRFSASCPGSCQLHLLLSTVLVRLGNNTQEATNEASLAVKADPKSVAAHLQYALVLTSASNFWAASKELQTVVTLDPTSYEGWSALADVSRRLHQDEQAQLAAHKAAELEANTSAVQKRVTENLQHGNQQRDAKELQQIIDSTQPAQ